MRARRSLALIGATGLLAAAGAIGGGAAAAFADELSNGQYLTNVSDYPCGHEEIATGATMSVGPAGDVLRQKALVYRACGSATVQRKADIIADFDGSCYTVKPGEARVLSVKFVAAGRTTFRGAKDC